ncbi:hypothetical protein [Desulforegula conservatrix]|uniref:hypothetical protein n=1 Tax=Desulforegula conservatrix TaxID=153026 RepID=UPI000402167C|nr:hypothetical protein [Desulforegula conservatrix]
MRIIIILCIIGLFSSLASADQNTASLPELSTQSFVGTQIFAPRNDNEWVDQCLNLNLDKKFGCKIIAYKIQWFSGDWSSWFVPGANDLYKKEGEPLRRFWACFNDHNFEILYMADSKINFSETMTAAQGSSVKSSDNYDSNKTDIKIREQGLELKFDGMVVCNKNGFKLLPVELKEKIKSGSTVSDAVKLLGPGYINSESGTGSITWFFVDGSTLSTTGWPSSVNKKVTLTESKDSPQKSVKTLSTMRTENSLSLDSGWGFSSLYYLFNKDRWNEVPKTGTGILHDNVPVELENPAQVILLHNAWSIPMAGTKDDIRLADLKKNVFKRSLVFTWEWPTFNTPGYVVAVRKSDGRWALIAEMGDYYFIENGSSIGVFKRATR